MSVVIAIKDKSRVVLGSDSQVTYGNYILKTQNKIFNISDNKSVLLGVCGYIAFKRYLVTLVISQPKS